MAVSRKKGESKSLEQYLAMMEIVSLLPDEDLDKFYAQINVQRVGIMKQTAKVPCSIITKTEFN